MSGEKRKKQLGEILKEKELIDDEHINFALQEQKITHERLGEIFVRLGFITEHDVVMTLVAQSHAPYVDLEAVMPDDGLLKLFNKNLCLKNTFFPIRKVDNTLEVATYGDTDQDLGQLVSRQTGLVPKFYLSERKKIINAVNKFYYFLENPVEKLIKTEVNLLVNDVEKARSMDTLVKHILHLAVKMRATDIHIRPTDMSIAISFRVDGVMKPILALPVVLSRLVVSLKMKAGMDIAEQRLPQDGRFSAIILNNDFDFRVSTIVSPYGENMVLRILSIGSGIMGMSQLGFFDEHIQAVGQMFNEPFGIVLLTGPTGSGKTTTLYAGIRRLNLLEKNVITVEEPIEYNIPLLRQTQVNQKAGYTFASAIRSFLRHDPDVILVGEIRDEETASTAITASTTGHLVLSTLHTNSAIGAIARLKDLGIRPFLIADSLIGVISQRLVRKICTVCKESYVPTDREKIYLKDSSITELFRGRGCEVCSGTGYLGRTLVYELLDIDQRLSMDIESGVELSVITEKAKKSGLVDIFSVMVEKVKLGITTSEEAMRTLGNIRMI
ncbi:MAG: Flp pilus assembly complex ATPase component [Desulfobacterales bacterium]|nr:Flp pilus assembly complex ATPase component [Desulfobacterales bacterium]